VKTLSYNSIFKIEEFKLKIDQGYEPSPEEVKKVSSLLGEPTKKVDVFTSRYLDVFTRLIQKNCVFIGEGDLCIYSWNPRAYLRYFPASIDATGTILFIKNTGEVELIAYPIHRSHDIEGHKVTIPDPRETPVKEVTKRIDGYQITFYYNPFLKRWIPATRYVLHNMRYIKGRLEISDLEEIINPFCKVADSIAREKGVYDKLKGFSGWTFTFILKPPEPAILKPNIELFNSEEFELYLLTARKPTGELLTVKETGELIKWPTVPIVEEKIEDINDLNKFIERASMDLEYRSHFIRFYDKDPYRPYTLEIKSKLYPEAMNIKYASNPKSIIILASYGLGDKAVELLVDYGDIKDLGREIVYSYNVLKKLIEQKLNDKAIEEALKESSLYKQMRGELERARRKGDVERFVRKLSAILAGDNIREARDNLRKFIELLSKKERTI